MTKIALFEICIVICAFTVPLSIQHRHSITTPILLVEGNVGKTYLIALYARVNWFGAHQLCAQQGLSLASINSAEEEMHLQRSLVNANWHQREFWLSGTLLNNQSEWYWLNNGRPLTYKHWADGYGSNANVTVNGCDEATCLSCLGNGEWRSNNCFERKYFICERNEELMVQIWQEETTHDYYYNGNGQYFRK